MTNYEKYADKIIEILSNKGTVAVINNIPVSCGASFCSDCDMHEKDFSKNCKGNIRRWLNAEYVLPKVDWSKVAVDTPIVVYDIKNPHIRRCRHFAKFENDKVYAWTEGRTSYTANGSMVGWDCAELIDDGNPERSDTY